MKWLLLGTLGGIGVFLVINEVYKARNDEIYNQYKYDKYGDPQSVIKDPTPASLEPIKKFDQQFVPNPSAPLKREYATSVEGSGVLF